MPSQLSQVRHRRRQLDSLTSTLTSADHGWVSNLDLSSARYWPMHPTSLRSLTSKDTWDDCMQALNNRNVERCSGLDPTPPRGLDLAPSSVGTR